MTRTGTGCLQRVLRESRWPGWWQTENTTPAAVQLQGYYSGLPYTGSGMKVGILKLGATSDKAEVSETGKECLVVDIDSESSTCGIIL